MKAPTLMQVDRVRVDEIEVIERLRPVSEAAVESLLASIDQLGVMKDPIHVRKRKDNRLVLIAGAHRLEAARRLGWETVQAKVWTDVTDDWARLMEVDDNIAGAELSPLDTAVFLAERKRIYEKLHPETKRGVAGALGRWDATDTMSVAFVKATAEKFGLSERHVRRIAQAGTTLAPDERRRLRSAPRPVTLKDLGDIAKVGNPAERYHVVEALETGTAKSAAAARRAWTAREQGVQPTINDPVEECFIALGKAWKRAPMAGRRRFIDAFADELQALLDSRNGGA